MRILSIWLPNWPIQRLVVSQPEFRARSIILYVRDARRGQRVAYCNRLARRQGVRLGMPLAEVESAASPDKFIRQSTSLQHTLHLAEHDPHADRSTLEQLAQWCQQFSPVVALDTSDPPTGLLIDVTRTARRLGGEAALAHNVIAALDQQEYFSRVAIADTIGAAWALSRAELNRNDMSTDDRVCIVPTGQTAAAIAPLSVTVLRLDAATRNLLDQLGIQEIGQLASLPREALCSRFGDELLRRLDQAVGRIPETMQTHRPPPALEATQTLEYATVKRAVVEALVAHLTQQLAQKLSTQDLGVIQMECHLGCENGNVNTMCLGLYCPSANPGQLTQLLQMQLEQKHFRSPIKRVRVAATVTASLNDDQHTLIDGVSPATTKQLANLINRLSCRLGRQGVVGVTLLAEPLIERSYHYTPLTGKRPTPPRSTPRALRHHPLAPGWRPLRLENPPAHIRAMSVAPHGPPIQFDFRGHTHTVKLFWGPERIETGWWRGPTIRRDYWKVEDQTGHRFWMFRELRNREWFVHGSG